MRLYLMIEGWLRHQTKQPIIQSNQKRVKDTIREEKEI